MVSRPGCFDYPLHPSSWPAGSSLSSSFSPSHLSFSIFTLFSPFSPSFMAPMPYSPWCRRVQLAPSLFQTQQFSIFACCSLSKCSAWTGSTLSKRQLVEQKYFLKNILFCFYHYNNIKMPKTWSWLYHVCTTLCTSSFWFCNRWGMREIQFGSINVLKLETNVLGSEFMFMC